MKTERQPYWWPSGILLLLGILVCLIILVVQFSGIQGDLLKIGSSSPQANTTSNVQVGTPSNTTWHKDAKDYCTYVKWLNNPQQYGQVSVFGAVILANSAPSPQAHTAALSLYKDLSGNKATQADIAGINSAYTCPTTSNQQ